MLIIVEALQGSGKTWLCEHISKLKHVICLDIDDIANEAYTIHRKTHKKITEIENKLIDDAIHKYHDKILVFVAVGLSIGGLKPIKYFMKIDNIEQVYRRFMIRETEKITKHKSQLEQIIKHNKVQYIMDDINKLVNMIVSYMGFDEYKDTYNTMLKHAKKRKLIIKDQQGIFNDIKKLDRGFS